ncbi:hypothetical protein ACFSMW_08390 [Virgibacillus halophilus]|uniref:Uncharacterized protein n=1 Tax=Tigheibacillus halophilus TaxID=361280 RepID=A0ABU5C532_9BACI|nr:hypothetical protein [Virgibacillus halophilus]
MSLYINEKGKRIFKNNQVAAPNQSYYQSDQRAALLQQQQRQMASIQQSLTDLKMRQMDSGKNWKDIQALLKAFQQDNQKQQIAHEAIFNAMEENKDLVQSAIGDEQETKQVVLQELEQVREYCQHLAAKAEKQNDASLKLDEKLHMINQAIEATQIMQEQTLAELAVQYSQGDMFKEQLQSHKNVLKEHMLQQENAMEEHVQTVNSDLEERQTRMSQRMENQEAAMEKMLRQINSLRAIIYERSNHLADKMEEGFRLSSAFAYNLLTRKDQPIAMVTKEKSRQS